MTTVVAREGARTQPRGLTVVRQRYAALLTGSAAGPVPWSGPGLVDPLPPHLCRRLNLGRAPECGPRSRTAYTGREDCELVEFGSGALRLRYATALDPAALEDVGLSGYRTVRPGPRTTAWMTQAVDTLPGLCPEAARAVEAFVSVLVLLKPRREQAPLGETMASCSFRELPFTAFLTGLGLHHLPPGFMFTEPSVYSLQESLYHEALHLWLNEIQRTDDHFAPARGDGPHGRDVKIFVCWQGTWWSAARCLHTLFGYVHLLRLRTAALERAEGAQAVLLEEAVRSARACSSELQHSLLDRPALLSAAGRDLVEWIGASLPGRRSAARR
ncbi:hypothetical protein [Streptomyces sp. FL07-04A]|jgi:hypothetical protein|uniref:hypothetical protein n=1 Tax=Streptomyces sp. FL07-04A TaxID=3028658 RepID=UPI0029A7683A|nr:hypothetical protein [Streptomyces sp. FL07-04A]MDX3580114.1 hypothetical protein [Streptomyces sp. FL07-04A]